MIFKAANFTRTTLLSLIEELTPKQLFYIPKGFKNNMIWNMAHILVTEQLLTYKLSKLELPIDEKFVTLYGKGSTPTTTVNVKDIEAIKKHLFPAVIQTEKDYKQGVFKKYTNYTTSTGVTLTTIEDALQFNVLHEGIHLGIILAIKKLLP